MGLLDRLKKMVGISGIKVDLVLPRVQYQQGEEVVGKVVITGGPEARLANALTVALVEEYGELVTTATTVPPATPGGSPTTVKSQKVAPASRTYQPVILAQKFQIGAGAVLEYPVAVRLPAAASVSGLEQAWRLKTELDLEGAIDAGDTDTLTVVPEPQLLASRNAICQAAGFPGSGLLRVVPVGPDGEPVSTRVYYL